MPNFDYSCTTHGTFDAFKRAGRPVETAPCPTCGEAAVRAGFTPTVAPRTDLPYDRQVHGKIPPIGRKQTAREGGGAAAVTDTGSYRPALTHHTRCPKEQRFRNVAVLAAFDYGRRVCCEACGYMWIHQPATTDVPLTRGVNESLRPAKRFFMGTDDRATSGYIPAARGA